MDKKRTFMTDYNRVQAGNWIEENRPWIDLDPSLQTIANQASKELGIKVTRSFVTNYLNGTDWYVKQTSTEEIKVEQLRDSILILNKALCKLAVHVGCKDKLGPMLHESEREVDEQLAKDNPDQLMIGGHA